MYRVSAALVLAVACLACGSAGEDGHPELEARVAALEQRPTTPATDSPQVQSDIKALERRLAALESEVAGLLDLMAQDLAEGEVGDPDAGEEPGRTRARRPRPSRAQREERRLKLRELSTEYRDRLGELRQQFSDDPRDPGRQEAIREVLDWYRTQRRAILRGEDEG